MESLDGRLFKLRLVPSIIVICRVIRGSLRNQHQADIRPVNFDLRQDITLVFDIRTRESLTTDALADTHFGAPGLSN
jgi:hypothetical protein